MLTAVAVIIAAWLAFDLVARAMVIIHGDPDTKHTYVVEILIGEGDPPKSTCSGTVIGPRKILTAAHCISGHETDKFRYKLDAADNARDDERAISEAAYPGLMAEETHGQPEVSSDMAPRNCALCYAVINSTPVHDIGLLLAKSNIPAPATGQLPKRALNWLTVIRNQKDGLAISGFGLTKLENAKSGRVRNSGTWKVDYADDWRFFHQDESSRSAQSTCNGDSGGPTIYTDPDGRDVIVGVTSTGSTDCRLGSSTRVDAYLDWINDGYKKNLIQVPMPPAR